MENKSLGILGSSVDPKQVSTTVKGVIISLSALLIPLGAYMGIPLSESEIGTFANEFGLAMGSLVFLYGLIQKVIVKLHSLFTKGV